MIYLLLYKSVIFRFFLLVMLYCCTVVVTQAQDDLDARIDLALQQGDYTAAIEGYQARKLDLHKAGEEAGFIGAYLDIAYTYFSAKSYDLVKVYLDSAGLLIAGSSLDSVNWVRAYYWNVLGNFSLKISDYGQAVKAFEEVLRIDTITRQTDPDFDLTFIGTDYQNIGVAYGEQGDHQQAIQYYQYALPFFSTISWASINTLNNIAFEHQQAGQTDLALTTYRQALEKITLVKKTPESPDQELERTMLLNLAICYREVGQYVQARASLDRAAALIDANDHYNLANYEQVAGSIWLLQGQAEQAMRHLENAWMQGSRLGIMPPSMAGRVRKLQGDAACKTGQYPDALQYYQKALAILIWDFVDSLDVSVNPDLGAAISSRPLVLETLQAKAQAFQALGQGADALRTYLLALDLSDQMRLDYLEKTSKYTLLNKVRPLYGQAIQLALDLHHPEQAMQLAERSKAAVLRENIRDLNARYLGNIPPDLLAREQQLKMEMAFGERRLWEAQMTGAVEEKNRANAHLFETKQAYYRFKSQMEEQVPEYYQLKYAPASPDLEDVRKRLLDRQTAVLEYFLADSTLYLFLLDQEQLIVQQIRPGLLNEQIRQLVRLQSQAGLKPADNQQWASLAHALYRHLILPAREKMSTHIRRLIIIPDGILGYLPFQALLTEPAGGADQEIRFDLAPYLIRQYTINYSYSLALLPEQAAVDVYRAVKPFGGFAPVFANHKLVDNRGAVLSHLPHSEEELRFIQRQMGGDAFFQEQAGLAQFFTKVGEYDILHLSTHATVNEQVPQDSRIYFADGYLSAAEIYALPLRARLTVLSACETGTGLLESGEGIMSLARAFAYAGCPSLLTSLWKVNDRQTAILMQAYYGHLSRGASKDEALRQAQLDYLSNITSVELAHPHYWAAFVPVGSDKPVIASSGSAAVATVSLALGTLLIYGAWRWKNRR